ncbi:OmpA family protein [Rhizobium sp. ARZ01]|uniref:OmpA family protein n=1 Tax=Rhizobium sp. ARZ01 TaxID=2769313 RepID=UPI00177F2A42|nr:OmpA family protein [Rhizobium sp. ARZ01]MBD9372214.1 OmpA family protein [Rhizobium sp. ARZ01]
MGNRTKLLATVALPIASIIWQSADAAPFHAMQPAAATQGVILVQSDEGQLSEEELRKLRRKQRQEAQQGEQEQQSDRQKAREERRKKQQEQQAEDQNRAAEEQQQSDRQKAREERRKKQQEQQAEEQNRAAEEQQQSDRQKAREERRKKQQEQQAEEENRAAEEQQQSDRQKAREERRKKQQEQQAEEQNRAAEEQQQSDRQKAREERRKKQQEQQAEEQNRAAEEQQQSDRQKAREERRKKQQEQQAEEQNRAAEEQQQSDRQRARDERRKKAEAERERRADEENRQRPRRERDPERERIARDPSKSVDTIELPVVGGAAVLDSDKDADNRGAGTREERRKRRAEERREEERRNARHFVPSSDADAQIDRDGNRRRPVRYESIERERGERFDRRPGYRDLDHVRIDRREDNRVIYNIDNRTFVRNYDGDRLSRRAEDTYYENLSGGRVRETIERDGGIRVVTIRDSYGEVIQRSRFVGDREYVLYYVPEVDYVEERIPFRDPGLYLPPMRLTVPVEDYIIDTSSDYDRDYRAFLEAPPVEAVERVYTLDEVKYSARIRDKVRRIDLDTVTFATGSAEISMEQASTLRRVADAINELLDENPGETFLIEGHTDAVGSDDSNLILSDERAESVANILTDVYDIPPENLSTQGYGERYLKVLTEGPEQLNRRVTIRRVTPLVKPVASAE